MGLARMSTICDHVGQHTDRGIIMKPYVLAAAFVAASLGLAHAETAEERSARCAAQAEIVQQAVAMRTEGKRENRAIRMITRARANLATPYNEAISPLTGWVYSLNDAQLQGNVAGEFRSACDGYKP